MYIILMGNSTPKFQQNPCPLNFQRAVRPHAIKQSLATLPNPLDKGPFTTMQNPPPAALTNSQKRERDPRDIFWQEMSRRSHAFFSEFVIATKKWFRMVANNPSSRGPGNTAKIHPITCSQSARP